MCDCAPNLCSGDIAHIPPHKFFFEINYHILLVVGRVCHFLKMCMSAKISLMAEMIVHIWSLALVQKRFEKVWETLDKILEKRATKPNNKISVVSFRNYILHFPKFFKTLHLYFLSKA